MRVKPNEGCEPIDSHLTHAAWPTSSQPILLCFQSLAGEDKGKGNIAKRGESKRQTDKSTIRKSRNMETGNIEDMGK